LCDCGHQCISIAIKDPKQEDIMAYVDDSGGTFIGNIGFGGVTPGFVIHAEKSVADKLAFFKNTNSSGYGVRFQNGTDLNYAIKVTNAAGTIDTMQFFGDGIIQVMPEPSIVTNLSGGLRRDQGLRIYSGRNEDGYNEDATLFLVSNLGGASTQWSGHAHMGYIRMGADGGMHMETNVYTNTSGAGAPYESGRPAGQLGFDSASTFSYRYNQPSALGVGAYSATPSQTFVISGAGQESAAYEETGWVSLMTMQGNRGMEFRVCAVTNTPLKVMQLDAFQHTNLFGRLGWNASATSQAPIRLPSTASPTVGNGDIWFDGTNFKARVGGVTKTFTLV
jgi:hypothetical protein